MKIITIIGAGMMGSALAFPARENGNTVRIVGTPLDREIIQVCCKTGRHPKFNRDFPEGISYYQFEELSDALPGTDFVICGGSSFGVEWYAENVLPVLPEGMVMPMPKGFDFWEAAGIGRENRAGIGRFWKALPSSIIPVLPLPESGRRRTA